MEIYRKPQYDRRLTAFHKPQPPSIAVSVPITSTSCMLFGKSYNREAIGCRPVVRDRKVSKRIRRK